MQKARQVIQTKQSEVIGTVSITPMGEWNADLNYEKDNYVRHNGATYMSRQPNKGIEPGVSQDWGQYWMLSIKDGASATVEVGETTTLPAGEQASVTNSGTNVNVVLDFAIPQGEQGFTGTVTVGNTITGQPGTEAVVENAGDEHNAILNFTIPRGEPGEPGNDPNAVHFTQQDLTDVQQQQARENIGAADAQTVEDILGGGEIVGKANADGEGNIIANTYAKTSELGYNAVLYTTAQTLTEEQKAQARANIGVDSGGGGKDIANATVTLGASLTFNGSAQEQTITSVTLNGETLAEGTDYKVAGNIATDAGNYTMAIMGIGDYSGTLWVDWSIAKAQGSISAPASVDVIGAVGTQKQVTVSIESGYGDLAVSSSAPNVVSASTVGNVIMLTSVSVGSATITVRLIGNYSAEESIVANVALASSVLNDNTWERIRYIADNDLGANYWAVGDTKSITINGTVGTKAYNNVTLWAYILGFNHNPDREGEHLIHFGCFKTAQTDGVDVALDDSSYNYAYTSGAKCFNMNHSSRTNSGGWKGCDMRYDILGSTDTDNGTPTSTCATNPVENTLMAALPEDLRAVMKPAIKYTNNTGGSSSSRAVTATQDYMPLLAEFEVQGVIDYANSTEQNYQTQYAYYANGNSKRKYRQTSTGSAAWWWCRSPAVTPLADSSTNFCRVDTNGNAHSYYADYSSGVAPVFFV